MNNETRQISPAHFIFYLFKGNLQRLHYASTFHEDYGLGCSDTVKVDGPNMVAISYNYNKPEQVAEMLKIESLEMVS
jgi:hypothetical protein